MWKVIHHPANAILEHLNLDNDRLFDENIEPITRIEHNLSIDHRQGFLAFHLQAACGPFKSQTGLIRRLQEARPQSAVHLNSGADNALSDPV